MAWCSPVVQRRRRHADADIDQPRRFLVFEIPLAWVLALTLGCGPTGIFIALALAYSILALISAVLFSVGAWKTKTV